jgi:hypothetical protein
MKKIWKQLLKVSLAIAVLWTALTIWAENAGPKRLLHIGANGKNGNALIVYDADPIYNLDQQVCEAFGNVLADSGWNVTIATVASANEMKDSSFHLYVFCANTYNWRPDWAVSGFIKNHLSLKNKNVVAITIGSGSTKEAQDAFEKIIANKEAKLIGSRSYWLLKPNDESRQKEKNVKVAVDMTKSFATEVVKNIDPIHASN